MGYDNERSTQQDSGRYQQSNDQSNYNRGNMDSNGSYNAGSRSGGYSSNSNSGGSYSNSSANSSGGYNGGSGGGFYKGGGGYNKGSFKKGGFKKREEDEGPVALYKPYVGSGNPDTPPHILQKMEDLARELELHGYTLRAGGLDGPETAFENGTSNLKEIHLPWKGFNNKDSPFTFTSNRAKEIASQYHNAYKGLKPAIQTILAKNVRVVTGKDLKSPALFAIVWSEDGAESNREKSMKTGNVGHLIAIADSMRIPIFNLGKSDAEERLRRYLDIPVGSQPPEPLPVNYERQQRSEQQGYSNNGSQEQKPQYKPREPSFDELEF
ncbi:MAG: hypothetical protein M0Q87_13270 [Ottowia sp.]|nr:hypothetical protein [Ottowia sp.]